MLTPREAIAHGQVWLRPFGHFCPEHQGYMGFSSAAVRDSFYDRMMDGALVIIWTRVTSGEPGWIGKFRGIIQLERSKVTAESCSSLYGNRLRLGSDKEFSNAICAVRAWEADPISKVYMKKIIPSVWPSLTRSLGHRSGMMNRLELPNIETLCVREVQVFGHAPIAASSFDLVRHTFI